LVVLRDHGSGQSGAVEFLPKPWSTVVFFTKARDQVVDLARLVGPGGEAPNFGKPADGGR
jgi:hypothetical protein